MAKTYVFGKYRPKLFNAPVSLGGGISLNGGYDISFWTGGQFADYSLAGLSGYEEPIPPSSHTATLPVFKDGVPTGETVPKQTRFAAAWFEDAVIDEASFRASLAQISAQTGLDVFASKAEAAEWVRTNTSLEEREPGLFVISPAHEFMGEQVPERLLDLR